MNTYPRRCYFVGPALKAGYGYVIGAGAILMRLNFWTARDLLAGLPDEDVLAFSGIGEALPHSFNTVIVAGEAVIVADDRIQGDSTIEVATPSGATFTLYAREGTAYRPLVTEINQ